MMPVPALKKIDKPVVVKIGPGIVPTARTVLYKRLAVVIAPDCLGGLQIRPAVVVVVDPGSLLFVDTGETRCIRRQFECDNLRTDRSG